MLKNENNYYTWLKTDKVQINQYFSTSEFTCHCNFSTCVNQKISVDLINKLTDLRKEINSPLKITSGFRCPEYQQKLIKTGVNTVVAKKSTHELGNAADVICVILSIPEFIIKSEKYFMAIGIAKTFLHLDLRNDKIRRWNY